MTVPQRRRLPDERRSKTKKLEIPDGVDAEGKPRSLEVWVIVSVYPDGTPGELFFRSAKAGSFESGILDALAIALSIGLQYGTPIWAYLDKFLAMQFAPSGFTGDVNHPAVKSVVDYLAQWLLREFPPPVPPE